MTSTIMSDESTAQSQNTAEPLVLDKECQRRYVELTVIQLTAPKGRVTEHEALMLLYAGRDSCTRYKISYLCII
jgi:hypothetical protein